MAGLDIAIAGATGRMGRMLLEAAHAQADLRIAGVLVSSGNALLGTDAEQLAPQIGGKLLTADVNAAIDGARVLIDFTRPEATLAYLAACRARRVNMVIGTTGFTPEQRLEIEAASRDIAIVLAPNMSLGVNVALKLIELATRALHGEYDIEIIEAHHRRKADAPSGTALQMGEVAARAMGRTLSDVAVYERHGVTGEREAGTIGFAVTRGGDIIGDHTVMFAGPGERVEITHKSSSRATYAEGALRAARFLADKTSGFYGMGDVLGL